MEPYRSSTIKHLPLVGEAFKPSTVKSKVSWIDFDPELAATTFRQRRIRSPSKREGRVDKAVQERGLFCDWLSQQRGWVYQNKRRLANEALFSFAEPPYTRDQLTELLLEFGRSALRALEQFYSEALISVGSDQQSETVELASVETSATEFQAFTSGAFPADQALQNIEQLKRIFAATTECEICWLLCELAGSRTDETARLLQFSNSDVISYLAVCDEVFERT